MLKYCLLIVFLSTVLSLPIPLVLDQYELEEIEKLKLNVTESLPEVIDGDYYEPDYRLLEPELNYEQVAEVEKNDYDITELAEMERQKDQPQQLMSYGIMKLAEQNAKLIEMVHVLDKKVDFLANILLNNVPTTTTMPISTTIQPKTIIEQSSTTEIPPQSSTTEMILVSTTTEPDMFLTTPVGNTDVMLYDGGDSGDFYFEETLFDDFPSLPEIKKENESDHVKAVFAFFGSIVAYLEDFFAKNKSVYHLVLFFLGFLSTFGSVSCLLCCCKRKDLPKCCGLKPIRRVPTSQVPNFNTPIPNTRDYPPSPPPIPVRSTSLPRRNSFKTMKTAQEAMANLKPVACPSIPIQQSAKKFIDAKKKLKPFIPLSESVEKLASASATAESNMKSFRKETSV